MQTASLERRPDEFWCDLVDLLTVSASHMRNRTDTVEAIGHSEKRPPAVLDAHDFPSRTADPLPLPLATVIASRTYKVPSVGPISMKIPSLVRSPQILLRCCRVRWSANAVSGRVLYGEATFGE